MSDKKEIIVDLSVKLKALVEKIEQTKEFISNEEQTKMSFIVPFFGILGYDCTNPKLVIPEFTADIGVKKGEKVDYAIMKDDKPFILIEAKTYGENLSAHSEQLLRYFSALKHKDNTSAQFGVLTNGSVYEFYTDAMVENIFDQKPFLVLDLEQDDIKNIAEKVYKFTASYLFNIDPSELKNDAKKQIYIGLIGQIYRREIDDPSEEFVKFFLAEVGKLDEKLKRRATSDTIKSFKNYIKNAIEQHRDNLIKNNIGEIYKTIEEREKERERQLQEQSEELKIITTDEEIEGFHIAKSIFAEIEDFDISRIVYNDTVDYFAINIDAESGRKTNKWLIRLYFNGRKKFVIVNSEECKRERIYIDNPNEIYQYKEEIKKALNEYLATAPKVEKRASTATGEFYFQNAKMRYENGKCIVLTGSEITGEATASCPQSVKNARANVTQGADGKILSDIEFNSPSGAACFVCGHSAQGTLLWKTADGMTFVEWQEQNEKR